MFYNELCKNMTIKLRQPISFDVTVRGSKSGKWLDWRPNNSFLKKKKWCPDSYTFQQMTSISEKTTIRHHSIISLSVNVVVLSLSECIANWPQKIISLMHF